MLADIYRGWLVEHFMVGRSTINRPTLLHSHIELLATFPSNSLSLPEVPRFSSRLFLSRVTSFVIAHPPPLLPLLIVFPARQNIADSPQNVDVFLITESQIALLNHAIQQSQFLRAEVRIMSNFTLVKS